MASLFSSLLSTDQPKVGEQGEAVQDVQPEIQDDIPLPEGAEVPSPEVLKQAIEKADQELITPVASRPTAAAMDSSANIMKTATRESKNSQDTQQETLDDPNDDIMSLATDVNHHARALDDIRSAINKMTRQLEIIPSIDARIRSLTTENEELKGTIKRLTTDVTQVRQSFNLYQSSTANKIADVERRAAEKQLRIDVPSIASDIVPPAELNVIRDPKPDVGRQSDTLPAQPLTGDKKKKIATLSDF